MCHSMHDCSIHTGDRSIKNHVDRYARWATHHHSWLVVTFDENAGGTVNPIPTIIVGDHVHAGPLCPEDQPLHPAPYHRARLRAARPRPCCRGVSVIEDLNQVALAPATKEWTGRGRPAAIRPVCSTIIDQPQWFDAEGSRNLSRT